MKVSPSTHWMPVVAGLGLDLVLIDAEHSPLDREKLAWMRHTFRAVGLPPIGRITSPDPYEASSRRSHTRQKTYPSHENHPLAPAFAPVPHRRTFRAAGSRLHR
ncbi:MAG: hypothetical protein WCQ89_16720 [Verrucomicrobiota bacterium]